MTPKAKVENFFAAMSEACSGYNQLEAGEVFCGRKFSQDELDIMWSVMVDEFLEHVDRDGTEEALADAVAHAFCAGAYAVHKHQ